MVTTSGDYKNSKSALINQLVTFADAEFDEGKSSSVGKIARPSEALRSKRASLVTSRILETPA